MTAEMVNVAWVLFEVAVVGGFLWKMPDWSRPEILFAITVAADVRHGPQGQALLQRYRSHVLWVTIVALAALVLPLIGLPLWFAWVVFTLHMFAVAIAFLIARSGAQQLGTAPTGRREALIESKRQPMPGGWLGQLGPFLILGGVAAWLAMNWSSIPEQYITHWNLRMEPDGWSHRSVLGVFGLLLVGGVTCAIMLPIAWSLLNRARQVHVRGKAAEHEIARKRAIAQLLLWMEYLMAAIFAPLGLMAFFQTPAAAKALVVTTLVLGVIGPIVLLAVFLVRYGSVLTTSTRGAEAATEGPPIGDRTDDRFWKWGLIYYNPDDPGLWIEKRFGVGYTFNFACSSAWWILGLTIAAPVSVTLAVAWFS